MKVKKEVYGQELELLQLFLILREFTKNVFLVGGCVRDIILKQVPKDFDVVVDFDIENSPEVIDCLVNNKWDVKVTGTVFKVLFVSKNNKTFEIASFRGKNIFEDCFTRDFTIGSVYCDPFIGKIIDPSNIGINDIQNKIIRYQGNPHDRINEDPCRIFRFFRFIKKGFIPEDKSLNISFERFNDSFYKISPDRVRVELEKMVRPEILKRSSLNETKIGYIDIVKNEYFIIDECKKIVSFNGNVKQLINKRPEVIFELFSYLLRGYSATSTTLSNMRDSFNHVYSSKINPEWLKNFIFNL